MNSKREDNKKIVVTYKQKEQYRSNIAYEASKKKQYMEYAQEKIKILEYSGILDAYEYFLKAICKNGLPEANIFYFAAQQVSKYQKKMKRKEAKREEIIESSTKEKQQRVSKLKELEKGIGINDANYSYPSKNDNDKSLIPGKYIQIKDEGDLPDKDSKTFKTIKKDKIEKADKGTQSYRFDKAKPFVKVYYNKYETKLLRN